jgi:hypothetical protein
MRFAVMLPILCLGLEVARAQATPNIEQVMHCIKTVDGGWLTSPLEEAKSLEVGTRYDRRSWERENHVVVAVFQTPVKGQVFDLTEERKGPKRIYTIENNGSFLIKRGEIDFVDPPLGGVWTQENLEGNIRKIKAGAKKRVAVSTSSRSFPNVSCKSYVAR